MIKIVKAVIETAGALAFGMIGVFILTLYLGFPVTFAIKLIISRMF